MEDKEFVDVLVNALENLLTSAQLIITEPDMLSYPKKDVYNQHSKEDSLAPFWSEAGLYGRVGKDAARTLLIRKLMLQQAINALIEAPMDKIQKMLEETSNSYEYSRSPERTPKTKTK